MTSAYIANVTGNGASATSTYRPSGFDAANYAVLMVDPVKARCLLISSNDTVTGTGITKLITQPSPQALASWAQANNPTAAQRTAVNNWLTTAGYSPLTAAQVSWSDCLHFAARQVNGAADLNLTAV